MTMTTKEQDSFNVYLRVIMVLLLTGILGVNGWALKEINNLGKQVIQNTERINSFSQAGQPYNRYDAEKDLGVLTKLLESQGKVVDDHEGRIRTLERK